MILGEFRQIESGNELPVCLIGDRLTFLSTGLVRCKYAAPTAAIEGDSWDGASVPRWAWSVIGHPLRDEFRWASFWHDRLCEKAECVEDRTIADAVFLRLLKDAGVCKWRRLAMWSAVRFYGVFLWRRNRGE